jgi:hypothetical protein
MIYNNSSWGMRFILKNGIIPYSLSGKDLVMRIAPKADQLSVLDITTDNSKIVIADAANGIFDVFLTAADTGNLQARTYVFEIAWTNAPGGYTRLFGGRIPVQQGIPS